MRSSFRLFRAALAGLPDGEQEAESWLDSDGIDLNRPIRMHVRVTVKRGEVTFDFTASDPQGKGPVNIRRALVEACCFQVLIGMIDPELRYSDAVRDAVDIRLTRGTVLDPNPPAPTKSTRASRSCLCAAHRVRASIICRH